MPITGLMTQLPRSRPAPARATVWTSFARIGLLIFLAVATGSAAHTRNLSVPTVTPQRGGVLRFVQEQVSTLDPLALGDVYSATVAAQIHNKNDGKQAARG